MPVTMLTFMKRALGPIRLPWTFLRYGAYRGNWLPGYISRAVRRAEKIESGCPIDIVVALVDHFEPGERRGDAAAVESVAIWCDNYARIAGRHVDADGRHPQHTWFYRAEYPNVGCIQVLADYCFRGFGE